MTSGLLGLPLVLSCFFRVHPRAGLFMARRSRPTLCRAEHHTLVDRALRSYALEPSRGLCGSDTCMPVLHRKLETASITSYPLHLAITTQLEHRHVEPIYKPKTQRKTLNALDMYLIAMKPYPNSVNPGSFFGFSRAVGIARPYPREPTTHAHHPCPPLTSALTRSVHHHTYIYKLTGKPAPHKSIPHWGWGSASINKPPPSSAGHIPLRSTRTAPPSSSSTPSRL